MGWVGLPSARLVMYRQVRCTSRLVGVRSIAISVSVCLSVCLLACLKTNPNSPNFTYVLPVAVARSFCDSSAIAYVIHFWFYR